MELVFIGYNHVHDSDLNINRPLGSGDFLVLLVKSPAIFTINGKDVHTPPNIFFMYPKNASQYYRAYDETFSNDWMHLELSKEEEEYLRILGIPMEVPVLLNDIEYFSLLINNLSLEYYSSNEQKKDTINCYLHIFFNKLSEQIMNQSIGVQEKNYDKFSLLRNKIYSRPYLKWDIANLSHQICLSPSYFQHLYKKHFGITCMADIIHARIEYAKQLLCTTSLSIRHIAEQCGYENDVHFMRQFKKVTGMTPTEYRNCPMVQHPVLPAIDRNKPDIY